ncbi:MAG: hypothetical protein LBK99_13110 [Opitutaceae bacterium]|jgi:hypothetical protein|nr:hypothetical protein [Opitutaceae bacterium]
MKKHPLRKIFLPGAILLIAIVASIIPYFHTKDPFKKLLVPPGHFVIEYLDENENGHEEFIMTRDLIYLKTLNPTRLSEISAWPKRFSEAGMAISVNYLEITDKKRNRQKLMIWATLWHYFQGSTTGKRTGLHTGRVLRVLHNITGEPSRAANLAPLGG